MPKTDEYTDDLDILIAKLRGEYAVAPKGSVRVKELAHVILAFSDSRELLRDYARKWS